MTVRTGPVSPRQGQILRLIAAGLTNDQIAHALAITPSTVKQHIGHILRRLDATDRTSAVVRAMALGVVPVPVSVGSESWSGS